MAPCYTAVLAHRAAEGPTELGANPNPNPNPNPNHKP